MSRTRPRFAPRQRASAWLGLAALLAALGLQPAHARFDAAHAQPPPPAAATLTLAAAGSPPADHDTGGCQVCRAASQVRSGLRAAVQHVGSPALDRPLHVVAVPLPGAAPALRDAWPRAPPAAHSA